MKIRGIRVNQWLKQESMQNLVRRIFPGTFVRVQRRKGRQCVLWWSGNASYEDMRALADEIEVALPVKAALRIECQRIPST
jgi:hypothetical protein